MELEAGFSNGRLRPGVLRGMVKKPFVLGLVLAVAASASAQSAVGVAQGLADGEAKAILKGDAGWYRTHLAPEYKATGPKGQVRNKAQEIANFDAQRRQIKPKSVVAKATKAVMKGNRLATTTDVKAVATVKGPDGKAHTMKVTLRADATWIKRGGVWTKLTEKTVSEKATMDGKPM